LSWKLPRASYLSRSPEVRLSPAGRVLRVVVDALIYLAHPRLMFTFRQYLGYWPRPALPLRYHEKYLWRKIFDHDPRQAALADKLAAKAHVRRHWPDIRVPALYWEGDDPDGIPEEILAGDCAIKANHGSGMNVLVSSGAVDRAELKAQARRWLRRRFGRRHHEWAYSQIAPRLFAEQLLVDDGVPASPVYKANVAGGECIYVYAHYTPAPGVEMEAVFDRDGRSRAALMDSGEMGTAMEPPAQLDELMRTAERLAAGFDFLRVDLYAIGSDIWFSEFTFYGAAGYAWVDDIGLLSTLNRKWDIGLSWFLSTPQSGFKGAYARLLRAWLTTADVPMRHGGPAALDPRRQHTSSI
jgi:hypothetical protein